MIAFPTGVRVWLATGHTDMRKGFSTRGDRLEGATTHMASRARRLSVADTTRPLGYCCGS